MEVYRLTRADGDAVIADTLVVARSFFARLRGLLGRSELPAGEGLYLVPCNSIHMFGMRFPIDVVFVDAELNVLAVLSDLEVGGTASWKAADGVIELPAGTAATHGLASGQRLALSARG